MSRSLEQIIEEQVRRWELQKRDQKRALEAKKRWPVITISRQFAAQGTALAEFLRERHGFAVWDKELLNAIADEANATESIMASLDEKYRSVMQNAIDRSLLGSRYTNSEYMQALLKVIRTIDEHGKSVIVGRGAHFVIDPSRALRVRLVGPLDDRVRSYSKRSGLAENLALPHVRRLDKFRTDFMRQHYKKELTEPTAYDLIINSSNFTLEQLADLVWVAYKAKFDALLPSRTT